MILLPLSKGKETLLDDEDAVYFTLLGSWCYNWTGYAYSSTHGYLHVLVAKRIGLAGDQFDHEDRNKLNNQRYNLRPATNAENNRNKAGHGLTSQYKGVCWETRRGVWKASILVNGKSIFIGYFQDEIKAAQAYDNRAKVHFGKFAYLNFPKV